LSTIDVDTEAVVIDRAGSDGLDTVSVTGSSFSNLVSFTTASVASPVLAPSAIVTTVGAV
jgi:hypothetical protein